MSVLSYYMTPQQYGEMARDRVKSILDRVEPVVARRFRVCTESFSELAFLMLIAYQLQDTFELPTFDGSLAETSSYVHEDISHFDAEPSFEFRMTSSDDASLTSGDFSDAAFSFDDIDDDDDDDYDDGFDAALSDYDMIFADENALSDDFIYG